MLSDRVREAIKTELVSFVLARDICIEENEHYIAAIKGFERILLVGFDKLTKKYVVITRVCVDGEPVGNAVTLARTEDEEEIIRVAGLVIMNNVR